MIQFQTIWSVAPPVCPALLVPEADGVHELVDHDARVDAAAPQRNLKYKHRTQTFCCETILAEELRKGAMEEGQLKIRQRFEWN